MPEQAELAAINTKTEVYFCHSPVDFCAHSRAYPRSLLLTHACADARIYTGE